MDRFIRSLNSERIMMALRLLSTFALFTLFGAAAFAQEAPPAGSGMMSLLFPIGLLVIFYFLLIRPQQKRQKEHKTMVENVKKGTRSLPLVVLLER